MSDVVTYREFARVVTNFEGDIGEIKELVREILVEARKTNGRVTALEIAMAKQETRVGGLEKEVFAGNRKPIGVVTMRDFYLVAGTAGTIVAIAKLLPALMAFGQAAR